MPQAASPWWFHLVALLGRASLGLYFLLAGVGKLRIELREGMGTFYEGPFASLRPAWLPDVVAGPYGYALPWAEVVVGTMLALGLATRLSAVLIALMLTSFTVALTLERGLGGGGPGPFHANFVMLPLALMFVVLGGGLVSVDALFRGKRATP